MRQLGCLLEIRREDLPQVKGKDLSEMLRIFAENGIKYRTGNVPTDILKPTQEDGKPSKVDAIATAITQGESTPPIVISVDGWILDGHHRWLAYKKLSIPKIAVICIMRKKWDALRMFDDASENVQS